MPAQETYDFAERAPDGSRGCLVAMLSLAVLLALSVAVGVWWLAEARRQERLDAVTADAGRLTLAEDEGGDLRTVDSRAAPDVYFRVDLRQAPLGERLTLRCEWIAPDGRIAHQNRYTTRQIDKTPWPTHAHYRFGPAAPRGTWTVRLWLDERELCARTFEVADGAAVAEVEDDAEL